VESAIAVNKIMKNYAERETFISPREEVNNKWIFRCYLNVFLPHFLHRRLFSLAFFFGGRYFSLLCA
jgi:hypothetical protein